MQRLLATCVAVVCVAVVIASPAFAQTEPATLGFNISPSSGPPGTRVQFGGDVPVDGPDFSTYSQPQFAYGLEALDVPTNPSGCNLVVDIGEVNKTVTSGSHITGSFVVGQQGGCFMSATDVGPQPARPGTYAVLLGCHGCAPAGTFTITPAVLPRTGSNNGPLAAVGIGLTIIGLALVTIALRRERTVRTNP